MLAEKRRCVEAMEADVSIEGQRAFIQLRRTLDDVRWRGEDITVLNRVVIRPPYTPESAAALQVRGFYGFLFSSLDRGGVRS